MRKHEFIMAWAKYAEDTGIKTSPHPLRHAYATILYEAGIDVKSAQDLLGHTSMAMTQDIYTHISQRKKDSTLAQLNQFISGDIEG